MLLRLQDPSRVDSAFGMGYKLVYIYIYIDRKFVPDLDPYVDGKGLVIGMDHLYKERLVSDEFLWLRTSPFVFATKFCRKRADPYTDGPYHIRSHM